MLISTLIGSIKFEAKVNATSEYDAWILDVLNEELLILSSKENYQENIAETTLTLVAGQGYVDLPTDFVRFLSNDRLKFYSTNNPDSYSNLNEVSMLDRKRVTGSPTGYEIRNNRLYFYPYSLVEANHRINLIYIKSPIPITTASIISNQFAAVIKHKAISRILLMKDSKQAGVFQTFSKEAFEATV